MTGPNSSGEEKYLSCSGFEIYGTITGASDKSFASSILREETRLYREIQQAKHQAKRFVAGTRVVRGPCWKWGNQDDSGGFGGQPLVLKNCCLWSALLLLIIGCRLRASSVVLFLIIGCRNLCSCLRVTSS